MIDQLESLSIAEQAEDRAFIERQDRVLAEIDEFYLHVDSDDEDEYRHWLGLR